MQICKEIKKCKKHKNYKKMNLKFGHRYRSCFLLLVDLVAGRKQVSTLFIQLNKIKLTHQTYEKICGRFLLIRTLFNTQIYSYIQHI